MSRSRRRRPFAAYCGGSQQQDKRRCNRATRRINRMILRATLDAMFMRTREVVNTWSFAQDGTRHYASWVIVSQRAPHLSPRDWYRWALAK